MADAPDTLASTLARPARAPAPGVRYALGRFGLFLRGEAETAYLRSSWEEISARARRFGLWGGLAFLLAAVLDRTLLDVGVVSWRFLALRVAVFGVALLLVRAAGAARVQRAAELPWLLSAFQLAVALAVGLITLGYRGYMPYRVVSVLVVTLAFYAYMPMLSRLHFVMLPALGGVLLLEIALRFPVSPHAFGVVVALLLAVNLLGWRLAVREARSRRLAWLAERRLQREMHQRRGAERNLRRLLEVCPVPLVLSKASNGRILLLNRAARSLFNPNRRPVRYAKVPATELFARAHERQTVLASLRNRGTAGPLDVHMRTIDGESVDVMMAARSLRFGSDAAVLASLVEITARKQHEKELHRLSETDPLTGLNNRRGFFMNAQAMLARDSERPLALVLMDVDHFKSINDGHGHAVGDLVLQLLAGRVSAVLRERDVLARIGGEEFAVLMPCTDLDAASIAAERIRQSVAAHAMRSNGLRLQVSLSIGVTTVGRGRMAIDAALQRADAAMYRAKHGGRDRVELQAMPVAI